MIEHAEQSRFKTFVQEFRPEIKFVLVFAVGVVAGFFLINHPVVDETVVKRITIVETYIAAQVLDWVGFENQQYGTILAGTDGNHFRMEVRNNCNGIYESIIFLMAFIAIQIPWRRKIGWMTIGFLLFHAINELRLISLFIIGSKYSNDTFVFFHETFWQYALVILTLGIFILCAHQVSKTPVAADAEEG